MVTTYGNGNAAGPPPADNTDPEYVVLSNRVCAELSLIVGHYLGNGWELVGGVSIAFNAANNCLYAQGLTRNLRK